MQVHTFYTEPAIRTFASFAVELSEATNPVTSAAANALRRTTASSAYLKELQKSKAEHTYEWAVCRHLNQVGVLRVGTLSSLKSRVNPLATALITAPLTLPMIATSRALVRMTRDSRNEVLTRSREGDNRKLKSHFVVSSWNISSTPLNTLIKEIVKRKCSVWLLQGDFSIDPPKALQRAGYNVACTHQLCILSRFEIVHVDSQEGVLTAILQVTNERFISVSSANSDENSYSKVQRFIKEGDINVQDRIIAGRFKGSKANDLETALNPHSATYRYFLEAVVYKSAMSMQSCVVKLHMLKEVARLLLARKKQKAKMYLFSLNITSELVKITIKVVEGYIKDVGDHIYKEIGAGEVLNLHVRKKGVLRGWTKNTSASVVLGEEGPLTERAFLTARLEKGYVR